MREVFALKAGKSILLRYGTVANVCGDLGEFFEFRNFIRDNGNADIVFLHTHPEGCTEPSRTDLDTWAGLRMGFGFVILSAIVTPQETKWYRTIYDKDSRKAFTISALGLDFVKSWRHRKIIRKLIEESQY